MYLIRRGQTEFNRVFSITRRDPGICDPQLTEIGRRQAAAIAQALSRSGIARLTAGGASHPLARRGF